MNHYEALIVFLRISKASNWLFFNFSEVIKCVFPTHPKELFFHGLSSKMHKVTRKGSAVWLGNTRVCKYVYVNMFVEVGSNDALSSTYPSK